MSDQHKATIVFGLSAIKHVGDGPIETIIKARGDEPFENLEDLCTRCDLSKVGKKSLESLVKTGALDEFADNRAQLLALIPSMISYSKTVHKDKSVGQMTMFEMMNGDDQP